MLETPILTTATWYTSNDESFSVTNKSAVVC